MTPNKVSFTRLQRLLLTIKPRSKELKHILKHTELHRSTFCKIKNGWRYPRLDTANTFVEYFKDEGLTLGDCFDEIEKEAKNG